MLKPDYFNNKADEMIEIYRKLEEWIFKDISQRLLIAGTVAGTTDYELWKLEQMGKHRKEIELKLQSLTKLSQGALRRLLKDAVLTSWDDDKEAFEMMGITLGNPLDNPLIVSIIDAEYTTALRNLNNLTRTTMNDSQIKLIELLNEVDVKVASGMRSYSAATCEVLDRMARGGLYVEYPSGTQRTLEAAVRLCVVTSMNQTSAEITNQSIRDHNIEFVLVSAHPGARPQRQGQQYCAGHDNWQGKVYKINGEEPGYPNLYEKTGYDINNKENSNPLGLHGYNCRHSHQPWAKGLKNPWIDEAGRLKVDSEESKKKYDLQQKQRAMERKIRCLKRMLLAKEKELKFFGGKPEGEKLQRDYDYLAYQLRNENSKYKDFCKENDLQKQYDRIKAAGFGKEQSSKANGRATAYKKMEKKDS